LSAIEGNNAILCLDCWPTLNPSVTHSPKQHGKVPLLRSLASQGPSLRVKTPGPTHGLRGLVFLPWDGFVDILKVKGERVDFIFGFFGL
jgi:hypothetical protein